MCGRLTTCLVSHPGLVVESFASRLFCSNARDYHAVILDVKKAFVEMVERHQRGQQHLMDHHLNIMQNVSINPPGCNFCVLKVPIHLLICGHKICDHCLEMTAESYQGESCQSGCPLCATDTHGL